MAGPGAETLTQVADGLWTIHHHGFRAGGLAIGTRTNVLRLADGSLALHSPGPLEPGKLESIRRLGEVRAILAPNLLHHMFLAKIVEEFPKARVIASPGIAAKQPTLTIDETLDQEPPAMLKGIAEMEVLDGAPKLEERVFFLPASRTLLAVDLGFNLHGMSGLTWLAMWMNDANDRFVVTRLARSMFIEDAAAAGRSVARMLARWDFDRIVVSHGEVLESGGRSALHAAWSWAM